MDADANRTITLDELDTSRNLGAGAARIVEADNVVAKDEKNGDK